MVSDHGNLVELKSLVVSDHLPESTGLLDQNNNWIMKGPNKIGFT